MSRTCRSILFTEFTLVGVVVALVLAAVAARVSAAARERLVVATSLALVVWFAGVPATAAFVAWALAFAVAVEVGVSSVPARGAALALLAVFVAAPVVAIVALGQPEHAREFVAFATNMAFLRFVAWARARWRGDVPRTSPWGTFLAFFFFPTFPNGPVETAAELVRPLEAPAVGPGLARVGLGVAKIAAVGLLLPPTGRACSPRRPTRPPTSSGCGRCCSTSGSI